MLIRARGLLWSVLVLFGSSDYPIFVRQWKSNKACWFSRLSTNILLTFHFHKCSSVSLYLSMWYFSSVTVQSTEVCLIFHFNFSLLIVTLIWFYILNTFNFYTIHLQRSLLHPVYSSTTWVAFPVFSRSQTLNLAYRFATFTFLRAIASMWHLHHHLIRYNLWF